MIKAKPSGINDAARQTMQTVTGYVTRVTASVTHCPTCGHKLKAHLTAAAKQKAYRERRKHV